jgi:hypothetical protein
METNATSTATPDCSQMFGSPQKEHAWLQKLVGRWTSEAECKAPSDEPVMKTRGTENVKSLGELWIVGEGQGEMPGGGTANMMLTLGYDPARGCFVGTWVGSMMTHLWVYEGQLDASGRILTLNAEGPSFADPTKRAKYQDIIEVISDDHRTLSSQFLGEDGRWTHFMTAHYRRVK